MTDEMIDINPSTEELNEILKRLRLGNIRKHIEEYLQKCTEAKLTPRQRGPPPYRARHPN